MIRDVAVIFQSYFILVGLQLMAWPWLYKYGKKLVDCGWASGRTILLMIVSLFIWFGGHLKFPLNNSLGIALVLLLVTWWTWKKLRKEIKPAFGAFRKIGRIILAEELLFAASFFTYALVRGFQPDILGLEKFMDYGLIKSYLSSPLLPANDMWWAGSTINYYSFGHFFANILIQILGVIPSIGYNLVLAFILASTLSLSFSVILNLCEARSVFAGLVGALLVTLGGNSHTLWYLIKNGGVSGYWYADATRFIHNTIHEFPGYSFVVSDLHGHVLDLPVVLLFILFFIIWWKEKKWLYEVGLGILLGIMMMANTWDMAVYGLLLLVTLLLGLISRALKIRAAIRFLAIVGITTGLVAIPWILNFKSISDGLGVVTDRSPLWQLLVLWSGHIGVTAVVLIIGLFSKKRNFLLIGLAITAMVLIVIPEFIYVRDIYPSHPRANTMFKLTYQAFIMMSLLFGWLNGKVINMKNKGLRLVALNSLFLLFGGLIIFPYLAFNSYYGNFQSYRGSDGFSFLYQKYDDEVKIIRYLDEHRDNKNLIEAVGDSYTETDFVSAFSGTPTILGWRVHEWLWRGGYDGVAKRDEQVKKFYEQGTISEAQDLIKKYNLGWVVVSPREKEKYKIDERKMKSLGKIVVAGKSAYLIKIK